MSQNLERFGVEAVWLDAAFEKGIKEYNQAIIKAGDITVKFSKKSTKAIQDFDRKSSASFIDAAAKVAIWARTAQLAFEQFERGAQEAAQRASLQALAASYGADASKIVSELIAISDQTLSTADAVSIANSALLAGGASFAAEVPRLFQIARAAATATGKDVGFVFDTLVKGIAKGSPLLIDNAEIYLSLGDAVEEYADSLGKTSDELTRQERTQATLQAVLSQGQTIVEGVGSAALEATQDISQLNTAAANLSTTFRAAVVAITRSGDGFEIFGRRFDSVIDVITQGLTALTQVVALASGAFATLFELMKFGFDDVADLITGQTTLNEILDQAADRGMRAFEGTIEAMGILKEDVPAVAGEVEELADAAGELDEEIVDLSGGIERFADAISKARISGLEAFLKRAIAVERQLEDAAIARARKIEQIERNAAARRAQIEAQFAQTIRDLQEQAAEDRRSRQINLARQLEQIERNYQERKQAIQQQFSVSFQRAVRSRDALALVEAFRTRNRELNEAKRQRDQERSDATSNAAQQEAEQKRSLQRQIEAARVARAQQIADAKAAQAEELEALRLAEEQKAEDRARADARWLEDQVRAFNNRRIRARGEYRQDETLYQQHLQRMLQLTNTYVPAIFRTGGGTGPHRGAGRGTRGGGGRRYLAEGGAFIAQGATQFTAGEAGPELVIAQPLSQITNTNPVSPQIGGQMRHAVSGEIQASMAGFQGRLTAAVNDAVLRAFREVLR